MKLFSIVLPLEALTIPYTIKYIGSEAFVGAGLERIDISGNNIHYSSENGIVYGAGGNAVVFYPNCYGNETFEIPSQVIEIGRSAFYGDNDLTSITIGNNIYKIGNNAFQDSSLESADIKNSVYFIGDHAFYNCLDLDTVKIADSVSPYRIKSGRLLLQLCRFIRYRISLGICMVRPIIIYCFILRS